MTALTTDYIQEVLSLGPFEGIDATTSPYFVAKNMGVDAVNFVPDRNYKGLVTTQGRADFGVTGLPSDPSALIQCLDATGVYYLALCPVNAVGQIWMFRPGGAASMLALPTGAVLGIVGQFVQAGFWTFLATPGIADTPLKIKYDTHVVTFWGINPPAGALTSAAGGAGNLNFPDYQWRVTFGVQVGGVSIQESSPGPASTPLALVNQSANLTNIPVSADPQVNERNLYRLDSFAQYRLVHTIADNVTTVYNDNTADDSVTGQNLILHRDPPEPFMAIEYHKDYMFGFGYRSADPSTMSDLLWATQTEPYGFNASSQFLPVSENLGNDVAVAAASTSALLLLLKQRTAHACFGDSTNDFYVQKIFDIGCVSKKSVAKAQGVTFWLSAEGVYAYDGSAPQYLSKDIKQYLDDNKAFLGDTVGFYKDRCYYLSFPSTTPQVTWQYDTLTQKWWKLGWATAVAYFDPDDLAVLDPNASAGAVIGGNFSGGILKWFDAETDLGAPIVSSFTSGIVDSGSPEATKQYRKLTILAPPQPAQAIVTVTADPGPAHKTVSRLVNLMTTSSQAQTISLPSNIRGREVQVTIQVTSSQKVQIQRVVLYGYLVRRLTNTG